GGGGAAATIAARHVPACRCGVSLPSLGAWSTGARTASAQRRLAGMISDDPRNWMWTEACAMLERAERLHRQFFEPNLSSDRTGSWGPPVDVFESESEIVIVVALPGVGPGDLALEIDGSALVIRGHRPLPDAARNAAIRRLEIPYGRFERRIQFGGATRLALGERELADGCLVLTLTKQY